jgi:P-type Ca2+ transporter type 2C
MSLAYSMKRMYRDGLLIQKTDATEKMGGVEEVCCGKSGTLTVGKLKVGKFYC